MLNMYTRRWFHNLESGCCKVEVYPTILKLSIQKCSESCSQGVLGDMAQPNVLKSELVLFFFYFYNSLIWYFRPNLVVNLKISFLCFFVNENDDRYDRIFKKLHPFKNERI